MKSYKEINADLHLDEQCKKIVIDQMCKPKHTSSYLKKLSIIMGGVIVFLFGMYIWKQDSAVTQMKQTSNVITNFDDYIDEVAAKAYNLMELADMDRQDMGEELKATCGKWIPSQDSLLVPADMDIKINYEQWSTDHTGPYGMIILEIKRDDSRRISVIVEDERIPFYTQSQIKDKIYQGYQLVIYMDSETEMRAYAKKQGVRYTLHALGTNREEFYAFLSSFLI